MWHFSVDVRQAPRAESGQGQSLRVLDGTKTNRILWFEVMKGVASSASPTLHYSAAPCFPNMLSRCVDFCLPCEAKNADHEATVSPAIAIASGSS